MNEHLHRARPGRSRAIAGALALLVAGLAQAADQARAELAFFEGDWTLAGYEDTYIERCRWLPGGGFLACHAEDRSEKDPSFSMSIFGYSVPDDLFTYDGFGGNGGHRALRGARHDGVWRFYGESRRGPAWRRWQVTITPAEAGFHFREEVSERGGPWVTAVELDYLRRPATEGSSSQGS